MRNLPQQEPIRARSELSVVRSRSFSSLRRGLDLYIWNNACLALSAGSVHVSLIPGASWPHQSPWERCSLTVNTPAGKEVSRCPRAVLKDTGVSKLPQFWLPLFLGVTVPPRLSIYEHLQRCSWVSLRLFLQKSAPVQSLHGYSLCLTPKEWICAHRAETNRQFKRRWEIEER